MKYYRKSIIPVIAVENRNKYLIAGLFICGVFWTAIKTESILKNIPVNPFMSDIIPAIKAMVQAFLSGNNPYGRDTILHLGYAAPSPYMPMHWMPYIFSELLRIDYRWITYSIWAVASFAVIARCGLYTIKTKTILITGLLFSIFFLVTDKHEGTIGMTVEPMVAGYYILLICSMNTKNAWLHGTAIGICLMSRYTLALWLPLWAFVLVASGNNTRLFKASAMVIILLSAFYILPYMSRDISMFFDSHMVYERGAVFEWTHTDGGAKPYHLFKGVGLAQFFYLGIGIQKGYETLRLTMFCAISITILSLGIWYWINKSKIDYRIFLMASFKIYLTVFLARIMVPYLYLMIVGNFVSVAIYAEQSKYKEKSTG